MQQRGQVLFRQFLQARQRVETLEIGREFFETYTQARDPELDRQGDGDHSGAEGGQRDQHVLQQVQPQPHYFRSIQSRVERVLQERGHAAAERAQPAWAPGLQQPDEDQELQGIHENARGRKIAFLARFFQAPLRRLLGLLLVGHGASVRDEVLRRVQRDTALGAEEHRQEERQPSQHGQAHQHFHREGYRREVQLRVDPPQQRERDIDHSSDGDDR